MDDLLGSELASLAPRVDGPAARAVFDRRRRARRNRRRAWLGSAALVAVALGSVGIGALAGRNDDDDGGREVVVADGSSTTSTTPSRPVAFEVLEMRDALEPMGTLRSAIDPQQLGQLWHDIGFNDEPPSIDFDRWVVVSITIPDDACPPELTEFARDGNLLTPVFVEPDGGCVEPLIPKTYVVALDRASAGQTFTLRLPADETYGFGEQQTVVETTGED